MKHVLVATDSDTTFDEVEAALATADVDVVRVRTGREVRAAVIELAPALVVLDLQIGSMGGFAACMDLRLEESGDRLNEQRILMLLDRDADVFLAKRSGADGWVIKPFDAGRLRKAATAILGGGVYEQEPSVSLGRSAP